MTGGTGPVLGSPYGTDQPEPAPPRRTLPGWSVGRAALHALDPRLTLRLRTEHERDAILATPMRRGRSIAVVGLVPGGGHSTVAALLATALGQYHGRRVLAIDAAGTGGLYRRLVVRSGSSMDAVLVGLGIRGPGPDGSRRLPRGWRWLRQQLSISPEVLLLASDPGAGESPMTAQEYQSTVHALGRYVSVMVSDTPALTDDPVIPAVVAAADRVVVVGPDDDRGLEAVRSCLPWITAVGRHRPDSDKVVGLLIRNTARSGRILPPASPDVPLFVLPHDPALASGLRPVRWYDLAVRTRESVVSVAAHLVRGLTRGQMLG
jgi:MinD-like ATPase involved in chromosome partitioning or flagellar assembly